MTIKNFFIDVWLTFRWGKWHVGQQSLFGPDGWTLQYVAVDSNTGEVIYCGAKRIAEGVCATENDRRGQTLTDKNNPYFFTGDSGTDIKTP